MRGLFTESRKIGCEFCGESFTVSRLPHGHYFAVCAEKKVKYTLSNISTSGIIFVFCAGLDSVPFLEVFGKSNLCH